MAVIQTNKQTEKKKTVDPLMDGTAGMQRGEIQYEGITQM